MKRKFLIFCLIANLTILFVLIINLLSIVLGLESVIELINSKQFINFRMILGLFTLVLWIFNLFLWSKKDKVLKRFIPLFFLIGIYSPFYFIKALNNKWI